VNTSQTLSANYRYDSFGNLISGSANTYRFSSKEWISGADLYYYGYRFYSPNYQRWINQDPIWEAGGVNLYSFVRNSPLNYLDRDGLDIWILKDETGWGHETVFGSNPDGTCWSSDKMPAKGRASPIIALPDISFNEKSILDPRNPKTIPKNTRIKAHIKTSPQKDAEVKSAAQKAAKEDAGLYVPVFSDCMDYANELARVAQLPPKPPGIAWPPSKPY
jgi:RHS repeat-associated protein